MKIGILSDIHGNHYALIEVLRAIKKEKIEKILIAGDIVGYYYHPDKVMELLQEWDIEFIKGNHESILEKILKNEIDLDPIITKYGRGHIKALENLSKKQLDFLLLSPENKTFEIDGLKIYLCHGAPFDSNFYLYPDTPKDILDKCTNNSNNFIFTGHSHYPFVYASNNCGLVNVGSVGQLRSIGGLASWVILNTLNKSIEIKYIPYKTGDLIKEIDKNDPEVSYLKAILSRNRT